MDRERNPDGDATAGQPSRTPCDYLLVVGPGRSGSTFLYRLVNRHAAFSAPRIKEDYYYRSPRRFEKALREAREDTLPSCLTSRTGPGAILPCLTA